MPIYAYQCQLCGAKKEVLQKISDQPLVDCSECGKPAMKKMVTAASFKLKGGGWYETDFKNSGKPKPENSSKSSDSGKTNDSATASTKSKVSAE